MMISESNEPTPPRFGGAQSAISAGPLAEEDFAAVRDLCATGLLKPVAILSQLHTWFALRRKSFPSEMIYFDNQQRLDPIRRVGKIGSAFVFGQKSSATEQP